MFLRCQAREEDGDCEEGNFVILGTSSVPRVVVKSRGTEEVPGRGERGRSAVLLYSGPEYINNTADLPRSRYLRR